MMKGSVTLQIHVGSAGLLGNKGPLVFLETKTEDLDAVLKLDNLVLDIFSEPEVSSSSG